MKEILAVVRHAKARETMDALSKIGCPAATSFRVFGRGRQKGLQYAPNGTADKGVSIRYLPKKMLFCVVNDRQWRIAVQTIIRVNQTGKFGDGKIFVTDVGGVCRVRTGEREEAAIR